MTPLLWLLRCTRVVRRVVRPRVAGAVAIRRTARRAGTASLAAKAGGLVCVAIALPLLIPGQPGVPVVVPQSVVSVGDFPNGYQLETGYGDGGYAPLTEMPGGYVLHPGDYAGGYLPLGASWITRDGRALPGLPPVVERHAVEPVAAPEPSTVLILAGAVVALGAVRRFA